MRKLGEQWVEEIDGYRHLVKAVPAIEKCHCTACDFEGQDNLCFGFPNSLCGNASDDFILKDLGILNEDGCLPSSWGGYPEVIRVGKPNFVTYFRVSLVVKDSDGSVIQVHVTGKTKQQAIDAWNRRV